MPLTGLAHLLHQVYISLWIHSFHSSADQCSRPVCSAFNNEPLPWFSNSASHLTALPKLFFSKVYGYIRCSVASHQKRNSQLAVHTCAEKSDRVISSSYCTELGKTFQIYPQITEWLNWPTCSPNLDCGITLTQRCASKKKERNKDRKKVRSVCDLLATQSLQVFDFYEMNYSLLKDSRKKSSILRL